MAELQQLNVSFNEHGDTDPNTDAPVIQCDDSDSVFKPKLTSWAVFSVITAAFCGCLPYGYSLGSINAASVPIKTFISDQYLVRYNSTITEGEVKAIFTVMAASFPVGGILGCFLVRPTVSRFGKLRSMAYLHTLTIIVAILMGLSKVMMSFEIIIIGQFVVGIVTSSAGTGISPMYCIEVVPKHCRGTFGALISFFIGFGVFVANILGLPQILGNASLWPVFLGLIGVPALIYLICCNFMASSPRTLYLTKSDVEGAEDLLKKLRDSDDVSDEMGALAKERSEQESTKLMSIFQILQSQSLRRQVIATVVISTSQQMSGMNGVIVYMNQLYSLAGVPTSYVSYCSVGVTGLLGFTTLISSRLLDKWGRLPLLIFGFIGMGTCLIGLAITAVVQSTETWVPYLSLVFAAVFLISFAIGPGPVTLLIASEFFPQRSRPAAITLACVSIFAGFTTTVIVWPYMQAAMGGFAYLPFAAITLSCAAFVRLVVPETKGKTFLEIEKAFKTKQVFCLRSKNNDEIPPENNNALL